MAAYLDELKAIGEIVTEEAAEVPPDYIDSTEGIRVLGSAVGSRIADIFLRGTAKRIGTPTIEGTITLFLAQQFRTDSPAIDEVAREATLFVKEKHGLGGMSMSA